MANPEHVEIVKGGRTCIEEWRTVHGLWAVLDLSRADLQGVSLQHADLRCANLKYANLSNAILQEANLEQASLIKVNFTFTNVFNANLSYANMNAALCKETNLNCSVLEYAYLGRAVFLNAQLDYVNLRKAYLRYVVAKTSSFRAAILRGTIFTQSKIADCDFYRADCSGADLSRTKIFRSRFVEAKCIGANFKMSHINSSDFTKADCTYTDFNRTQVQKCHFLDTNLRGANLDAIRMYGTETEGWDITAVRCRRFYTYVNGQRIRLPHSGKLFRGEFEDRFKSRPTIEFIFEHGIPAFGPAVLGLAIDEANREHPETDLRLLSIDAKGGIPRAIIEIAEKISKKDAIRFVQICYLQKVEQMQKEIEGLKDDKQLLLQLTSQKMLLPAMASAEGYFSYAELARQHKVDPEALRKRLDRHRAKCALDTDFYVESQDRGVNKPRYLYNAKMVVPIVESLKKKRTSFKRPSEKK